MKSCKKLQINEKKNDPALKNELLGISKAKICNNEAMPLPFVAYGFPQKIVAVNRES